MNKDDRSLTHEKLADSFDEIMNSYDADRRLAVLIADFLSEIDLEKAKVIDAGCGTEIGSKRLKEKGSEVVSVVGLRPYDKYENFIRPAALRNH